MRLIGIAIVTLSMTASMALAVTSGQLRQIERYLPSGYDANTLTNTQANTILSWIHMDWSEGEKRGKVRAYLN